MNEETLVMNVYCLPSNSNSRTGRPFFCCPPFLACVNRGLHTPFTPTAALSTRYSARWGLGGRPSPCILSRSPGSLSVAFALTLSLSRGVVDTLAIGWPATGGAEIAARSSSGLCRAVQLLVVVVARVCRCTRPRPSPTRCYSGSPPPRLAIRRFRSFSTTLLWPLR